MNSGDAGWSALPDGRGEDQQRPDLVPAGRVTGIGALCDLRTATSNDGRSQSFTVTEFVTVEGKDRVTLDDSRGFTIGWGSNMRDPGEIQVGLTLDEIRQTVLNTVLPDDDEPAEDHPWALLTELAQARGLDVTEEDLRNLSYEVILSDRLIEWLQPV